jgi:hypothetical protein
MGQTLTTRSSTQSKTNDFVIIEKPEYKYIDVFDDIQTTPLKNLNYITFEIKEYYPSTLTIKYYSTDHDNLMNFMKENNICIAN